MAMELSSMVCGSLDGRRGVWGEEWIQIYVCLSPFAVQLKLLQHSLSVVPQNKIFLKKKKKTLLSSLNSSSFNRPPQQHGTLFCTDAKITPAGNSGLAHPGANEPQNTI